MRTSITHKELNTFSFQMTDQDVLARVDEANELRSQEESLMAKKKLIQKEISSLTADVDHKLQCISRREEPREVDCEVIFDYKERTIITYFEGEEMASRRMSEWEFSSRPVDVMPEINKTKVEGETKAGSLDTAVDRATEIAQKEALNQVPSGDVRAQTEAKTETSVLNS